MDITIADYITLLDGNHLLETERVRSKFFRFQLPDDFVGSANITRPVLTYRVRVPGSSSQVITGWLRPFHKPFAPMNTDYFQ